MSKNVPVSFRIPAKYVVFLDVYGESRRLNRTQALIELLDYALKAYLKMRNNKKP